MLNIKGQTLIDVLESRAANQADRLSYCFVHNNKEDRLTYEKLDKKARAIASYLTEMNLKGERALLLYPQGLDFMEAFMGCLYAGVIAVAVHPPATEAMSKKISHVVADCQPKIILSNSDVIRKLKMLKIVKRIKPVPFLGKLCGRMPVPNMPDIENLPWLETNKISLSLAQKWSGTLINPNDVAFLQYTSGSTRMPKGVMVTHENIIHNEKTIKSGMGFSEDDIFISWLPLFHDLGLIGGALQSIYSGFPLVFADPVDFIKNPYMWLKMIDKYNGSCTGSPNFGYDYCVNKITERQKETLDLRSWRVAFNGAEPIKLRTIDRFYDSFKKCGFKKSNFDPVYGLAEATLFVTGNDLRRSCKIKEVDKNQLANNLVRKASSEKNKVVLVSSGHTYLDVEVAIASLDKKEKCKKNIVGEIWIKSKSNAKGYWGSPKASKDTFSAYFKGDDGPYLRTSDLGFLDEEGNLFVTGRLKDVIKIRGEVHYPQEIEYSVEKSSPAIRKGCVAAFLVENKKGKEELVVVAEVKTNNLKQDFLEDIVLQISSNISEEHQIHVDDVVLIKPRKINKTTSGKIQRHKVKQLYLEKRLQEIFHGDVIKIHNKHISKNFEAPHDEVEQVLSSIFCKVLSIDSIGVDEKLTQLGGDSLSFIQASMIIERELGISLQMEDIYRNNDIMSLAKYIKLQNKKRKKSKKKVHSISAPISPMQKWFFDEKFANANHYNIALSFKVFSNIDVHYLEKAVKFLVQYHDILRLRFRKHNEQIIQNVEARELHKVFERHDLSKGFKMRKQKLMDKIEQEAQKSLNYQDGPIVKILYFNFGNEPGRVVFIMHHLAGDYITATSLIEQLEYIYQHMVVAKNIYMPDVKYTYLDYCNMLPKIAESNLINRQARYWNKIVNTKIPYFPIDYRGNVWQKKYKQSIYLNFSREETKQLQQMLSKKYDAKISEIICAAVCSVMGEYLKSDIVPVNIHNHGRVSLKKDFDAEKTMGWMAMQYPLILPFEQDKTKLINNVQSTLSSVPTEGVGFGLLKNMSRQGDKLKYFKEYPITIYHHGNVSNLKNDKRLLRSSELEYSKFGYDDEIKKRDYIGFYSSVLDGRLSIELRYSKNCLKKSTVQKFARNLNDFIQLLYTQ